MAFQNKAQKLYEIVYEQKNRMTPSAVFIESTAKAMFKRIEVV